nr:MAG TPA: hypothetical protein [Caudoviricetes sp.]
MLILVVVKLEQLMFQQVILKEMLMKMGLSNWK